MHKVRLLMQTFGWIPLGQLHAHQLSHLWLLEIYLQRYEPIGALTEVVQQQVVPCGGAPILVSSQPTYNFKDEDVTSRHSFCLITS